ncbi:hypothetical protein [Actinokineospora cianjurensis]|uniref:Uncharacterized protein n=1 Tax=Actinokineospora cianjurensis TaxID=585224 RepID=A0A421BAE3_9PSEU|nr:hypothetical protein [Actinokineospora cianjurensis]RLK61298.1 hypothetical protein CLV68_1835 [Actinokineospora cianjurensis]
MLTYLTSLARILNIVTLRQFRQNAEVTALARDHGACRVNGYRYLDEVIDVLADQALDLHDALEKAKPTGSRM